MIDIHPYAFIISGKLFPVRFYPGRMTVFHYFHIKVANCIQGNFRSLPPDGVVIRKFWKNSRYRAEAQDVRLIEDEPLPEVVVEEAVVEEAAEMVVEEDVEVVVKEAAPEEEAEAVVVK